MTRDEIEQQIHLLFDTPDRFRAWLNSHSKEDEVGKSGDAESCPLATFAENKGLELRVEGNALYWNAGEDGWYDDEGEWHDCYWVESPKWVEAFVDHVDHEEDDGIPRFIPHRPITTRVAKKALAAAIKEA